MSVEVDKIWAFINESDGNLHKLLDRRSTSLGFNAFALVSDIYRRENFHSDILSAILDPHSKHGEGALFLRLFIDYLARVAKLSRKDELEKRLREFRLGIDVCVAREESRIDILVEGADWVIVIENKINGAHDMYRQLPRYVEKVRDKRKKILAIVYITAAIQKDPDMDGWTQTDKKHVSPLLLSVVGYNETKSDMNLVEGWLERCVLEAKDFSAKAVLTQYCELLRNQAGETMNKNELLALFKLLGEKEIGYNDLLTIIQAMPNAFASEIVDECKEVQGLKDRPWVYRNTTAVFNLNGIEFPGDGKKRIEFVVDVRCENLSKIEIVVFDRNGYVDGKCMRRLEPLFKTMDDAFECDENNSMMVLSVDTKEAGVFGDIRKFVKRISSLVQGLVENSEEMIDKLKSADGVNG